MSSTLTKRNSTILALRGKRQLKLIKFRNNEVTGDILLTQIFALNGDGNGAPQKLWKRPKAQQCIFDYIFVFFEKKFRSRP